VYQGTGMNLMTKILPTWFAWFVSSWYCSYYHKYKLKTCEEVMCGELGMSKELMFTLCYLQGDHGSLPTDPDSFIIQSLVCKHYIRFISCFLNNIKEMEDGIQLEDLVKLQKPLFQ
jgi:hypothetical protein